MPERSETSATSGYCLFETAIGPCGVAWSDNGLTQLTLPQSSRDATERRLRRSGAMPKTPPALIARAIGEIERYCSGAREDFSGIALDLSAVEPFDEKVYEAARSVSWGSTVTYGELARKVGSPNAAREVGEALSRNPIPIIVPCHRILAKGNRIGGFSAYGGVTTKERLLTLEGVDLDADAPLLPGMPPRARRRRGA